MTNNNSSKISSKISTADLPGSRLQAFWFALTYRGFRTDVPATNRKFPLQFQLLNASGEWLRRKNFIATSYEAAFEAVSGAPDVAASKYKPVGVEGPCGVARSLEEARELDSTIGTMYCEGAAKDAKVGSLVQLPKAGGKTAVRRVVSVVNDGGKSIALLSEDLTDLGIRAPRAPKARFLRRAK